MRWQPDLKNAISKIILWVFKLSVVFRVEKGEMTYMQAQRRHGLQGCSTVLCWLRKNSNLERSEPSL